MRIYFYILLLVGTLAVLYLSWVSSPAIGKMAFMPSWISSWVDSYRFSAFRTSIPLVVLGVLVGVYLNFEKKTILWWYMAWGLLTLLVILAEIGQYFRPLRRFDFRDIFWGSAGAALGLQIIFFLKQVKCYIWRKKKKC
ncbi:VanZ family protein [Neotamlana nanhaiensis]|uniref:VanZ family protein n=1 Tax=Neotamlana nanhaiensis TaxID=1382798 RepID=UPI00069A472E|nr:VanZ family protein [Tamlana nanhaiensis]